MYPPPVRAIPTLVLASFALAGCPRVAPPTSPEREVGELALDEPEREAPFDDDERVQSSGKLGGVWSACYRGLRPEGEPIASLGRLAAACAKPTGLAAVTPVKIGETQGADDPADRFAFRARGGRCYRVFAVGDDGVDDLDVAVLDPDGRLAAADVSRDRFPVVPPRGPLCAPRDTVYTLEVAVVKGRGAYALQVYGD